MSESSIEPRELLRKRQDECLLTLRRGTIAYCTFVLLCLITLGVPAATVLGDGYNIQLAFAQTSIQYNAFLIVAPFVLFFIWLYLQVFLLELHDDKYNNMEPNFPTLWSLKGRASQILAEIIFIGILPILLFLFAFEATIWSDQPCYWYIGAAIGILANFAAKIYRIRKANGLNRSSGRAVAILYTTLGLLLSFGAIILAIWPTLLRGIPIVNAFSAINLARVELHGTDFKSLDAQLAGGNFAGAKLVGVTFRDQDLSGSDFTDAEIRDSDLTSAKFTEANLTRTKLIKSSIRFADFAQARFLMTELINIRGTPINMPRATICEARIKYDYQQNIFYVGNEARAKIDRRITNNCILRNEQNGIYYMLPSERDPEVSRKDAIKSDKKYKEKRLTNGFLPIMLAKHGELRVSRRLSWNEAMRYKVQAAQTLPDIAKRLSFYPLTVASAEEQDFISENFILHEKDGGIWLAASRDEDDRSVWKWRAGLEAGQVFWKGGPKDEGGVGKKYANWANSEPNDSGRNESVAVITNSNFWNDIPRSKNHKLRFIFKSYPCLEGCSASAPMRQIWPVEQLPSDPRYRREHQGDEVSTAAEK